MFNLDEIRKEFPVVEHITYLNHAACAPISTRVRAAIELLARDHNEYAAAHHSQWDTRIEEVRRLIARLINTESKHVAFVKNTSEGVSFVASGLDWRDGDNVIINNLEFPSNVFPWMNLKHRGVETRIVEARDGRVLVDDIRTAMDHRTRVVAVSHIEYANGYRNDIDAIGHLCRERGVYYVLDVIQSLGHIRFDLAKTPADIITGAAYKWLMGPEGIGIFYCSPDIQDSLDLYEIGCYSMAEAGVYDTYDFTLAPDARRFESGTPNTIGIYGLGAAIELLLEVGVDVIENRLRVLSDTLTEGLQRKGYRILSPRDEEEWSGIVTFMSDRYPAEDLHQTLRDRDIIGARRFGGIRISPHFYNTEDEVLRVVEALPDH